MQINLLILVPKDPSLILLFKLLLDGSVILLNNTNLL